MQIKTYSPSMSLKGAVMNRSPEGKWVDIQEAQAELGQSILKLDKRERDLQEVTTMAAKVPALTAELEDQKEQVKALNELLLSNEEKIRAQAARVELLEVCQDVVEMTTVVETVTTANIALRAQVGTLEPQVEDMKELLTRAQETIQTAEGHREGLKKDMETLQNQTALTISQLPNLKPLETVIDGADITKSVIEVWGQAVWIQLSPELQNEIIFVYAQAVSDQDVLKKRMEDMELAVAESMCPPHPIPVVPDSATAGPEPTKDLPEKSGSNSPNQDLPSGS